MPDDTVSLDEYLSRRKPFVKGAGTVVKAFKAPASWNQDTRSARFTMSSEKPDRDKDIIRQDGIDISEFMKNPQGLLFHMSRSWPIGQWSDVTKVNGRPKRTEGTLTLLPEGEDPDADRAAAHIRNGTLRACSIGFIPKTIKRREREQDADEYVWPGYEILESELVECSVVPIPAQPAALIKSAGGDTVLAREIIESVLDEWVRLPNGVTVPREDYEKALTTLSGEKTTVVIPAGAVKKDELARLEEAMKKPAPIIVVDDRGVNDAAIARLEKAIAEPSFLEKLAAGVKSLLGGKTPAEPPAPPAPVLATAEEKAAAQARAAELDARIAAALGG